MLGKKTSSEKQLDEETRIVKAVNAFLETAIGRSNSDDISSNRRDARSAYLGNPDGKEIAGRSSVVSTDVADAIEWIMPEIVKSFTQNNDIVRFDARFEGDEEQAEIESAFVYDILMKDNNGFLVIHEFIKDCLLEKNGFVKVYYIQEEVDHFDHYTGVDEEGLAFISSLDDHEIVGKNEVLTQTNQGMVILYDVKVKSKKKQGKIVVECIPPEDMRIDGNHNSIDLSSSRFTSDISVKTASDLVKMGYPRDLVDDLPEASIMDDDDERRIQQGESIMSNSSSFVDKSQKLIRIAECVMNYDYDDDGIGELVKVTVAMDGDDKATHFLEMEDVTVNPYISATAILMSHKLMGLSIYDRLKQIQDQKTALWRQIFDNLYLQNNQRIVALRGAVELNDLLVSRPGRVIRVTNMDAIRPFETPPLSGDAYKMMDYLDQVRAGRAGVSPDGSVSDSLIGDRVGSNGLERIMNQKEELVGLMVRVIAEIGIKPLCAMIRKLAIAHQDVVIDYKHHGKWVKINPSTWIDRPNTTIRVGTGTGNRQEQQAIFAKIQEIQNLLLDKPNQALVNESVVYNAIDDFVKLFGLPGAARYFIDPASPEGQQFKKQVTESTNAAKQAEMKMQQAALDAQINIANAEHSKAITAQANVVLKAQSERLKGEVESAKQEKEQAIAVMKQELDNAKAAVESVAKAEDLKYKYWDSAEKHKIAWAQIESQEKMARENNSNNGGSSE